MSFEKEYYEASEFWSDGAITDVFNTQRIDTVIELFPDDARSLLDIGCGNGVLVNKISIQKPDLKVVGIDRSEEALKFVKTQKKTGDILNIPEPDNSVDCVSCLQVLEHIPVPGYQKALSELARASSKYILIGVPYKEKIEKNVTTCPQCYTIFNVDLHLRSYKEEDIKSMFIKYGFELEKMVNIVKTTDYLFVTWIIKIKNILRFKKTETEFRSPICPICGYTNQKFVLSSKLIAPLNKKSTFLIKNIKRVIKFLSPKVEKEGYWIIALYKKNNL